MRPPGLHLCGIVALAFMVSPIHAASKSSSAKPKTPAKSSTVKADTAKSKSGKDSDATEHVVKKGETLWSISQKYSTSVGEVMELNKLPKEYVREGMKLKIPPKGGLVDPRTERRKVHVVDDDETFWSIAGTYNVTPEALANANPNVNPNRLHPDMELIIPPSDGSKTAKPGTPLKPAVTLKDPDGESPADKSPVKPGEVKPTAKPASTALANSSPASGKEYVIEEGDTFYALGRKFGVSMEAILAANPQVDPRRMKNGTKIVIPDKVDKPVKSPAGTAPAEEGHAGSKSGTEPASVPAAKPSAPAPTTVAKITKPLPSIPAPNTLPIPKPKVTALASEQVKKQIVNPVSDKKGTNGNTSPVVIAAPNVPPPETKPKVTVNPPASTAADAPPSAPVMAKADKHEEKTSDEHAPVANKGNEASASSNPPAPVKTVIAATGTHEMASGKPQANTVGSDGVIRSYIVSDGETEGSICESFGISKEQLYEYNRLPATARLKAGDEIMIPRVAKIR
jgi:LysM repeat protein